MQAALGRSVTEEQAVGLSSLTPYITGHRGLLLTNTAREEVLSFFQHFSEPHYARSGCIAPRRFLIEKGPCAEERIGHAMEPHLRKLGLPTRLHEGKVEVLQDVVVCKEGDVLTPEQCRLLQLFGEKMAVFRVEVVVGWDAETGQVEELIEGATKERVKGGGERVGRTKRAGGATTGREEEGKEEEEEEEEVEDDGERGGGGGGGRVRTGANGGVGRSVGPLLLVSLAALYTGHHHTVLTCPITLYTVGQYTHTASV